MPNGRDAGTLDDRQRLSVFITLVTVGVLISQLLPAILTLGNVATFWPPLGGEGKPVWTLAALAIVVPLYTRHNLYWIRGLRPPLEKTVVVIMSVTVLAAVPLCGAVWLSMFYMIAFGALTSFRAPFSYTIFVGAAITPLPLSAVLGSAKSGLYLVTDVVIRTIVPLILMWLVNAARQLTAARSALADQAVTTERLRIDAELKRTLAPALHTIMNKADRADTLIDRPAAATVLRAMVSDSRQTLAETRRLVRKYQHVTFAEELENAASLLAAAGIHTEVAVPPGGVSESDTEKLRTILRTEVGRLIEGELAQTCRIVVSCELGIPRVELTYAEANTV